MNRVRLIMVSLVLMGGVLFASRGNDLRTNESPLKFTQTSHVMLEENVDAAALPGMKSLKQFPPEKVEELQDLALALEQLHDLNLLRSEHDSGVRAEIEEHQENIRKILALVSGGSSSSGEESSSSGENGE